MKRLGFFSGKVYPEDYDFSKCPECCLCISDEEAENEDFINETHNKHLLRCVGCFGCPAAQDTILAVDKI